VRLQHVYLKSIINILNIIGPIFFLVLTIQNLYSLSSVIASFSVRVLYYFWSAISFDAHYVTIEFPMHYFLSWASHDNSI
jgi:hypothetical protein